MSALAIARRELASYLLSPVSYLVAALFLCVEGHSFFVILDLLSGAAVPHGAVLHYFFGGTILYWVFVLFVCSVCSMRLVAEERRQGTLELVFTAPVDELDFLLGKYLAALGFYAILWAPTLLFVAVLAHLLPPEQTLDAGPIVTSYAGTLCVGAAALAVGLCTSAATRSQLVAAVASFFVLVFVLLCGTLGAALGHATRWAPLFRYIDLFRQMDDFARGIVDSRALLFLGSVAVLALFTTHRLLVSSRGR